MLILFDIDGTLLRTDGTGVRAFVDGLVATHAPTAWSLDGISLAGQLDSRILKSVCVAHGVEHDSSFESRFRTHYRTALCAALERTAARPMPGMQDLVAALRGRPDVSIGLLTGNYSDTGRIKVSSAGFNPDDFVVNAFAEDGAIRRDLTPAARERDTARRGRALRPDEVVVIGDTPDDVDCARHHGCRSLAVATGIFTQAQLAAAGASRSVTDCSDVGGILDWIGVHP